jgi:hypothetical protein
MNDFDDVGVETVSVGCLGGRLGSDCVAGDLRFARPLRLGALDRVNRGAVQGEPWIATQIRALACSRHRAERQLSVLKCRLDPGDPGGSVGSQGGDRLVPVRIEQAAHVLRELRLRALDVLP